MTPLNHGQALLNSILKVAREVHTQNLKRNTSLQCCVASQQCRMIIALTLFNPETVEILVEYVPPPPPQLLFRNVLPVAIQACTNYQLCQHNLIEHNNIKH